MTCGSSAPCRQRSQLSSTSSESTSPAMKCTGQIQSDIMSFTKAAPSHSSDTATKQTSDEMWSILVDTQGNVSKILTENQALRREVEDLKSSLESSDVQIANLKQLIEGSSTTF